MIQGFHVIALGGLLIGTFTDFKLREVPDWLNFALISLGIFQGVALSILKVSISPLLFMLAGLLLGVGIGYLMFYTGQWGGGDSKMIMGLGALIGLNYLNLYDSFLLGFLVNILMAGAIYGLIWVLFLAIRNFKAFAKEYEDLRSQKQVRRIRIAHLGIVVLGIIFSVIISQPYKLPSFIITALIFFLFHLWFIVKAIEKSVMIKYLPVDKLTEGDWIVEDVKYRKKQICGPKDLGISKEQIALLKKYKIKKVKIKEGIPFIPSFLLAYLFTYATIVFYNTPYWLLLIA